MGSKQQSKNGLADVLSNRPFIVGLLYLLTFFTGITMIVGVILAYIFKRGQCEEWETSHFSYLIRTFWIGVIGVAASVAGLILFMADYKWGMLSLLPILVAAILAGIRTILSMIKAVRQEPMPRPNNWLI